MRNDPPATREQVKHWCAYWLDTETDEEIDEMSENLVSEESIACFIRARLA